MLDFSLGYIVNLVMRALNHLPRLWRKFRIAGREPKLRELVNHKRLKPGRDRLIFLQLRLELSRVLLALNLNVGFEDCGFLIDSMRALRAAS
jgi:hypothetical protein